MRGFAGIVLAALLLLGGLRTASAQFANEKDWSITENPGAHVTLVAADDEGNIYDVERGQAQRPVNFYDAFGELYQSFTFTGTLSFFVREPVTDGRDLRRRRREQLCYVMERF